MNDLTAERKLTKALRKEVESQAERIRELEPKAAYFDRVLSGRDAVPISVIAKDYGWSAIRMNRFLHECGVQYRCGKVWLLYADYAGHGFTQSETMLLNDFCGRGHPTMTTRWTQKGRLLICALMKAAGYLPAAGA